MIPISYNAHIKEMKMKKFRNKLKQINKKCGVSQNVDYPTYYITTKKEIIIDYLDVITSILEPDKFNIECCFNKKECDDISEILSKLKKKLLEIDSGLEDAYKELIIFDDCMEKRKESFKK